MRDVADISPALLAWYDRNARVLPWRTGPEDHAKGLRTAPYRVWLSEVMLQQTTVAAVRNYFRDFTTRWPTVTDLAQAEDADVMAAWAGLGYYARARNLLKCARVVAFDLGGQFPRTAQELQALPGIGPYTAAAIASIAFDAPATVVDGNVERVVSRLFALTDPLPGTRPEIARLAGQITPQDRPGDHAQAMMDLGATLCTPRNPVCALCPLEAHCEAHAQGIAASLPVKAPKKVKPTRRGHAYVLIGPAGEVLVERRPDRGLLGGTLGFPTSDWAEERPAFAPPLETDWQEAATEVRHTFTHFHLILTVHTGLGQVDGMTGNNAFSPDALPTLMRKVWEAAQPA
ncbi:A/G-specific adenine glycosylase [Thioclava sp. GXIMD4215]|uniref:A/G-specific adenine glycosylase n=1 Tax=Thioclava sp. GXIMD4215 TaxID=3131928 RepID=UPI003244762E